MGSATDKDLEKGVLRTPSKQNWTFNLLNPSTSSTAGKKKYVKQVTDWHNNTELLLAAQQGDLASVKHIFDEIKSQVAGNLSGADFDAEVSKIRASMVNEGNGLRATPLYMAAEKGHHAVVEELLKYSDKDTLTKKGYLNYPLHIAAKRGHLAVVEELLKYSDKDTLTEKGCLDYPLRIAAEKGHLEVVIELLKYLDKDILKRRRSLEYPLHKAAKQGHHDIVKLLLDHDVSLCQTRLGGNPTPLVSAASNGHTAVVEELLSKDPSLLYIPEPYGQNALHLAARSGHVETVKSLIEKYPQLARRTDQNGQTALHMAVEGARSEVVKLLLCLPDTDVNALTSEFKTALDMARKDYPSEELIDIQACLVRGGAVLANELNRPLDELRYTVTQIKYDVRKIAEGISQLSKETTNSTSSTNSTNSFTVAVLFATISFASLFTVPGGEKDDGTAVAVNHPSFQIFLIFNALALYMSLSVVLIQTTMIIRGKTNTERGLIVVINWLIWLASMCTSVAFMASSYIVVGRKYEWGAIFITTCGGITMAGVFVATPYYTAKVKGSHEWRDRIAKWGSSS